MSKEKAKTKRQAFAIDLSKLESVVECLEGLEERRDHINEIRARGWV